MSKGRYKKSQNRNVGFVHMVRFNSPVTFNKTKLCNEYSTNDTIIMISSLIIQNDTSEQILSIIQGVMYIYMHMYNMSTLNS